ncbi:MAG: LLM class flavin-dependent oxidoreductase [Hyphomicrobiaceae bacterium]
MKLTLFIGAEHGPSESMTQRLNEHVEQVRLARQLGFDGVTIGNHLSYGSTAWFPPFETLMRLAADAEGMALGTCMLVLPLYEPLHVAEQVALLDAACDGRAILGVAPGWTKDEFAVMDLDHGRRISRYKEAVEVIRRLYAEDRVTFAGRHFNLDSVGLALKPTRQPRPPMWFGGSVDNAVKRAASLAEPEYGDSWVASSHLRREVIVNQSQIFKDTLAKLGKPVPADFPVLRNIVVAPDRDTALREVGPAIAASYNVFGKWGLFTDIVKEKEVQAKFDELIRDRFIIGSPEECAEELTGIMQDTGCNRLITRIQWLSMEHRHVMRTIELLGDRVAPMIRKAMT